MATYVSRFATDLANPPGALFIPHQLAMGDSDAHIFVVDVYDSTDAEAAQLAGTVTGAALRPDGGTVVIEGTKGEVTTVTTPTGTYSATPCSVTLPQAALAYPGRLNLAIRLVVDDTQTTVLNVSMMVTRTMSDTMIDPGEVVPDLATLIAQIERCETATEDAEAVVSSSVRYDQVQSLTEAQQIQARSNIGTDFIDYYKSGWAGHRGTAQHNLGVRKVADPYTSGAAYAVGDYVIQDGDLYRCTTAMAEAPADFWSGEASWQYIAPTPEPASAAALTAEATARAAADTALADDLADEVTARTAADTAEATARAAADDALTEDIAGVDSVANGAFGVDVYGADYVDASSGSSGSSKPKATKKANTVTLDGRYSLASYVHHSFFGGSYANGGNATVTDALVNGSSLWLKAGRTYRLTAQIVSGNLTPYSASSSKNTNICLYMRPLGGSVSYANFTTDVTAQLIGARYTLTADTACVEGKTYYERVQVGDPYRMDEVTPEGTENPSEEGWYEAIETPVFPTFTIMRAPAVDTQINFGVYMRSYNDYDDLTIRFGVEDITYLTRTRALAPHETATASQAYAAGSLLTQGGLLYQATTAIGAGESITAGTNVTETSVAQLLTPVAGTVSYVSNSYINSGMESSSWLKVYPFGLAVLFLFIPVSASLPSDGTTVTTGRVSHPPLASFGQGMSANDPSLGIVANINADGTIQVYTKGASKPSSGWGTYSATICYPCNPQA